MQGYLHPRIRYSGSAYASRIHVGGDDLGDSYGISGSIDYILLTETRKRPEVAVGYSGTYSRFNSEARLPGSVTRELGRRSRFAAPSPRVKNCARRSRRTMAVRSSTVSWIPKPTGMASRSASAKRIDTTWSTYFQAGVYRDFADEAWEYTVAAGVEYWLNDHAMLYLDLRHDSDGLGADSKDGAWQASLGAEVNF